MKPKKRVSSRDALMFYFFTIMMLFLLAFFCELARADYQQPNAKADTPITANVASETQSPTTDSTSTSSECVETEHIKPSDDQKPAQKKKSLKQTTDTEMRNFDISAEKKCLMIKWSVGEKMLLSFWGEKYQLSIYYQPAILEIIRADFTFKDTTDSDNVINISKKFQPPLSAELNGILKKWLNYSLNNLNCEEKQDDSLLVENFDLRPFYEKYVKPAFIKRVGK